MRTKESLLALVSELEGDKRELTRVLEHNRHAWERIEHGADDPVDWGGLAFTIHTLYGVLENYFLRISKYFENNLSPDRWHQELVEKMRIDIPGLRPPLFTNSSELQQARELVRFRHRVRNLYGEDLDPEKTRDIQATVEAFFGNFRVSHSTFVAKLEAIADEL